MCFLLVSPGFRVLRGEERGGEEVKWQGREWDWGDKGGENGLGVRGGRGG